MLFTLRYINPLKNWRKLTFIFISIPAVIALLIASNNLHGMFYQGWSLVSPAGASYNFLAEECGLAFIICTAYGTALRVFALFYIVYISLRTTRLLSAQSVLLIFCTVSPLVASLLSELSGQGNQYINVVPIALLLSFSIITYLSTGMRAMDLAPIARDMIIKTSAGGTVVVDAAGIIVDINTEAEKILKVRKHQVLGRKASKISEMLNIPEGEESENSQFCIGEKTYNASALALKGDAGKFAGRIIIIRDVTKIRHIEKRIRDLVLLDSLTGLPNHFFILQELDKLIVSKGSAGISVMLVNIGKTAYVNSSYGYDMGNKLIKKISEIIKTYLVDTDIFARMNGDDFLIVRQNGSEVSTLAQSIVRMFTRPIVIDGKYISTSVSIGICECALEAEEAGSLIQKASLALGLAKRSKERFAFYSEQKEKEIMQRNLLMNALRTALEKNEFSLEYQPQYNYASNSLFGAEALLRWRHPEYGEVPPSVFIKMLEDSGMIVAVGDWVIEQASRQFRDWMDKGLQVPRFSVNLSVRQFDNENLVAHILSVLDENEIPRHCLEIEVTETLAALADSSVVSKITQLTDAGVRIAIDDFGSGFSSLTYFKYLNIKTLKIDREISLDIHKNKYSCAILDCLKRICDTLGVEIITEYVETAEQVEKLVKLGCMNFQGFYYSRPLKPNDFEEYMLKTFIRPCSLSSLQQSC